MMKDQKKMRLLLPLLIAGIFFLPVQLRLCQAANASEAIVLEETKKQPVPSEESESALSTPLMIGIGAAVLLGGAVALGSSGGGGGDSTPPADPIPPTPDQLVAPWHAEGNQPGSGRTYSGTYHLYQGGSLGYDLHISDGDHLVGGGSWRLDGYTLSLHTDHGSLYRGDFVPGNITSVSLNANTGWNLVLTR